MIRLTLAAPEERFREQILAYRTEFLEAGDHMAGCAGPIGRLPSSVGSRPCGLTAEKKQLGGASCPPPII